MLGGAATQAPARKEGEDGVKEGLLVNKAHQHVSNQLFLEKNA